MANINLSQSSQQRKAQEAQDRILDRGLAVSLGVLIITVGVWAGVAAYASSLESKKANLEAEIEVQSRQLQGEKVERVLAFHERSQFITEKMKVSKDPQEALGQMEKLILSSVALESYRYDADGSLTVEAVTDSFKNVSQQIMSLKSFFRSVAVEDSSRNDNGDIAFTLKVGF
jgi:Tfp pilus assembly protein PilN